MDIDSRSWDFARFRDDTKLVETLRVSLLASLCSKLIKKLVPLASWTEDRFYGPKIFTGIFSDRESANGLRREVPGFVIESSYSDCVCVFLFYFFFIS